MPMHRRKTPSPDQKATNMNRNNDKSKQISKEDALKKLAYLCAKAEHASGEMLEKMYALGFDRHAAEEVVGRLVDLGYVDDERFARAFINDKVRFNGWGRKKIEFKLWEKKVEAKLAKRLLDEVDDQEYTGKLVTLLKNKRRSVKASTDYDLQAKLYRFAVGRGFTHEIIRRALAVIEQEDRENGTD